MGRSRGGPVGKVRRRSSGKVRRRSSWVMSIYRSRHGH